MPDLDKLISKILSGCQNQADEIIETANKKAAELMSVSTLEAEKEKERILTNAEAEAERAAERLLAGKKLEIRDSHLEAKRQVIDKVFALALEKLNNMPKEQFQSFLQKTLPEMDLEGCQIALPEKYGIDISELNSFLKSKGLYSGLKKNADKNISGGFVLLKEGVESNNTFETLLSYYRDELETEIIAKLF